ncbi:uncharacterized protein LOC141857470 [Brevipalpus obovatus]|uniref:uncharacterized protein LOC141857470 n=1 Tax=Brevipalpus obovatus TaxID=246614 RepID=UPI003D9EC7BD
MSEYKIRPASSEDCGSIHEQMRQLAEFEKLSDKFKLSLNEFIEDGFGDGHSPYFYALVAEKCADKSIVGYMLYHYSYSSLKGKTIYLLNIYVDPNHRAKGIASALLEYLCRYAAQNKFMRIESSISKWNEPSIKLHQAFGAVNLYETLGKEEYRIDFEGITKAAAKPAKFFLMMSEYKIRLASVKDCCSIHEQMKQLAIVGHTSQKFSLKLDDFIGDGFSDGHPPYFYALLAEKCDDKSIAGYLLYHYSYSSLEGKTIHMENIYVDSNHRGKGIASALMEYLCRFAAENKFMRIESGVLESNKPSIKLHQTFEAINLHEALGKTEYRIDFENIKKAAMRPPRFV